MMQRLFFILLCGLPIISAVYFALIDPRPYEVNWYDGETWYYYNSAAIATGLAQMMSDHPGVVGMHFGALIFKLLGFSPESIVSKTQFYLNGVYIAAAILASLSSFLFVRSLGMKFGLAALFLLGLASWPPFYVYFNFFSAETLIIPLSLGMVWGLHNFLGQRTRTRHLLFIAASVTLAFVSKITFLPVIAALLVAVVFGLIVEAWQTGEFKRCGQHFLTLLLAGPAFALLWSWPIRHEWAEFLLTTVAWLPFGFQWSVVWHNLRAIGDAFPSFLIFPSLLLLSFGFFVFRGKCGAKQYIPGIVFVSLLLLAGLRSLGFTSYSGYFSLIFKLRNQFPVYLALVSFLLPCFALISWRPMPRLRHWLPALCLSLAGYQFVRVANLRGEEIRKWQARVQSIEAEFASYNKKLTFYVEGVGYLGPYAFHFWGVHRTLGGYFHSFVEESYPEHKYIYLRQWDYFRGQDTRPVRHCESGALVLQDGPQSYSERYLHLLRAASLKAEQKFILQPLVEVAVFLKGVSHKFFPFPEYLRLYSWRETSLAQLDALDFVVFSDVSEFQSRREDIGVWLSSFGLQESEVREVGGVNFYFYLPSKG